MNTSGHICSSSGIIASMELQRSTLCPGREYPPWITKQEQANGEMKAHTYFEAYRHMRVHICSSCDI